MKNYPLIFLISINFILDTNEEENKSNFVWFSKEGISKERRQVLLLFAIQIVIIVLMGLFTTYGPDADAKLVRNLSGKCPHKCPT